MDLTFEELESLFVNGTYTRDEILRTFKAFEKSKRAVRGSARVVFDDWREVMEEPRGILDTKRIRLINRALENYTVEDLKLVNRGCVLSAWHMGTDPKRIGTPLNFPELIYRDAEQIEKLKAIAIGKGISPDATIRKSDYDGSRPQQASDYTEFVPGKRI